jgi:hypothetical protein
LATPIQTRRNAFSKTETIAGGYYTKNTLSAAVSQDPGRLEPRAVDCFRDIRFRNTALDGSNNLQDTSGNGLVGIEDTTGIPVYKDNGSALPNVTMSSAGHDKCGYITFYDVADENKDGTIGASEVKVKHFPESSTDASTIIKIPVGNNPSRWPWPIRR